MASEAAQIAKLPAQAPGRFTGVAFPTSIAALVEAGPEWLTRAFHATDALPAERRVVAIERTQEFFGGGMGRKLILDVRYDIPDEGLDERLFCKFPRDLAILCVIPSARSWSRRYVSPCSRGATIFLSPCPPAFSEIMTRRREAAC